MAYNKVVEMLGDNLASFLELSKKFLVDWNIDPKKLLNLFHNIRKEDLAGLIDGSHEIKPKQQPVATLVDEFEGMYGAAIREFEITVPLDYDHQKQIDQFAKRVKKQKTTYFYNDSLSSQKLVPGKTYKVKIFPILRQVTSEDNMKFLRKQNAILVGGQGLTLVHDLNADMFPVGKWTVSFDEKEVLWKDSDGYHRVPRVFRDSGGAWWFALGCFGFPWAGDDCLLCFCDL